MTTQQQQWYRPVLIALAITSAVGLIMLFSSDDESSRLSSTLRNSPDVTHRVLAPFSDPKSIERRYKAIAPCLELRGQDGSWVPSEGYSYPTPEYDHNKKDDDSSTFVPQTKWKWQDSADQCQMQLFHRQGFCDVMMHFQFKRIFFVGDSITFQMFQSFWQLMSTADADDGVQPLSIMQIQTGEKEPKNWHSTVNKYKTFRRDIDCGPSITQDQEDETMHFTFEVVFVRSDNFRAFDEHSMPDAFDADEGYMHQNWLEPYASNPAKTILVANTGLHTPNQDQYANDFDQFVETIQSLNRPLDIIVFRTTVPGHEKCSKDKQPFAAPSDYKVPSLYQWGSIDGYNQYSKQSLSNLGSSWLLLDIYPMTILRPDGHAQPNMDCLHYNLPGPPDWWNHLLYNNLLDLVTVDNNSNNGGIISSQILPGPRMLETEPGFQEKEDGETLSCLELRGQDGTWRSAKGYMYDKKQRYQRIEPQSQWVWQDSARQCQMHILNREGLCFIVEYYQLRRIFFLGDSLTYQMMNSFWWLMGQKGYGRAMESSLSRQFECGVSDGVDSPFTFEVFYARNDNLHDVVEDKVPGVHTPWLEHYTSNPAKTILVASTGLHTPDHTKYVNDLDQFVETVQSLNRPQDMVVYRTSVPGHPNCNKHTRPLTSFRDYHAFATEYQGMDKDGFNQYTKQKLSHITTGTWLLLDVYPMTILRPDGHKSQSDCLKYLQPGPVDWWNHLLYSSLLDLARSRSLKLEQKLNGI